MKKSSSARFDDSGSIFACNLELIRSTLRSYYRMSDDEVRGAEEDLRTWFERLARRGPSPPAPRILQLALLSAACQYGRSFQFWKLRGEPSPDEGLNAVLARQPDDVAHDAKHRFDSERS